MFRLSIAFGCVAAASAFAPSALLPSTRHRGSIVGGLSMQVSTPTAPVDIFKDMDKDGQEVKSSPFLKESEVKHGRLAMLAAVGWPAAEFLHPYLSQTLGLPNLLTEQGGAPSVLTGGLANMLSIPGVLFLVMFALGKAYSTETDALRPRNNFLSKDAKEMYPYDLGFDPLGFYQKSTPAQRKTMAEKELNNGRLAMIAISLYPFIELATKHPVVGSLAIASGQDLE